jgi:thioredoxin reductase (NADPH)
MSTIDTSRELMFPKLSTGEIDRLRRFGTVRRYAAGELLYATGDISPGTFVILSGSVAVSGREGLGHVFPIIELGLGGFLAEVGQLSGRPTLVDARAVSAVETLLIPTDRLRTVLIAEAELGERIMRALILRRVGLVETGAGGPVLIGPAMSPDLVRMQGFLARNASPHRVLDPADDHEAAALLERYALNASDLPLVVCANGSVLKNPTEVDLARALGMVRVDHPDRTYDVAQACNMEEANDASRIRARQHRSDRHRRKPGEDRPARGGAGLRQPVDRRTATVAGGATNPVCGDARRLAAG